MPEPLALRREHRAGVFRAAAAAVVPAQREEQIAALKKYGLALGRAFQVVDDVLDFTSTEEELGKPVGSDIRQGHLTLPVILFAKANPEEWHNWVERVPQLVKGGDFVFGEALEGSGKKSSTPEQEQAFKELVARIATSSGVEAALYRAADYARSAQAQLAIIPDGEAKDLMRDLAEYCVERTY